MCENFEVVRLYFVYFLPTDSELQGTFFFVDFVRLRRMALAQICTALRKLWKKLQRRSRCRMAPNEPEGCLDGAEKFEKNKIRKILQNKCILFRSVVDFRVTYSYNILYGKGPIPMLHHTTI
jgi:hypothetical protein